MIGGVSDRALVRACLGGDRKAWEELVRRYERLIYSIPRRAGMPADDAADVFQTVCLRLFQNLESLRDVDRIAGWLRTTATREVWRLQRKGARDQPWSALSSGDGSGAEDAAERVQDPSALPQELVERTEEEQEIWEALLTLGERCRKLLGLLYYAEEQPSYAEIAASLAMPEGSIGPTRARCLTQLRKKLGR
jgi:RNA polymerase sigma factor (sigma-70 family)